MDFMKLLKSLEELLYELASWIIFYPLTLWRSVATPLVMMKYADTELADREEDQYDDALSPPLFMLITLLIAQGVSFAIPSTVDATEPGALSSGSNLLIARGVLFSMFPLVMAVTLLRRKSVRLTRTALRPPFYSQCFVAAPFAFMIGLSADLFYMPDGQGLEAGLAVLALSTIWYVQLQVRWFCRDLNIGALLATWLVLRALLLGTVLFFIVALVIGLEAKNLA